MKWSVHFMGTQQKYIERGGGRREEEANTTRDNSRRINASESGKRKVSTFFTHIHLTEGHQLKM